MQNGVIQYVNFRVSLFVVKLADETYSVFETNHVGSFKVNDQISGHLDKTGIYEVLNATTQKYHFVNVEKVGLSKEDALQLAQI